MSGKLQWRSVGQLRGEAVSPPDSEASFKGQSPETVDVDRRSFLGIMGASSALAGVALAPGCIRKPAESIFPYSTRPEDLIPGKPRYYRTGFNVGGAVLGLHVASQDGRPVKVEGNPEHSLSGGATDTWAQASVLDLYDPDRSKEPRSGNASTDWDSLVKGLSERMTQHSDGTGLALLLDGTPSLTRTRLLAALKERYPAISLYRHDNAFNQNQSQGLGYLGANGASAMYDLDQARVVVTLDSDILGEQGDSCHNSRSFGNRRRAGTDSTDGPAMNRLYTVEPMFSLTGVMADHRLRVPGSHVGEFLRGLAGRLLGADAPEALKAQVNNRQEDATSGLVYDARFTRFLDAVAADLADARGESVVVVGDRQPAWAHALAARVNTALGNTGKTVRYVRTPAADFGTIGELAQAISAGQVKTLVMLDTNPAYDAPADLNFSQLLGSVEATVHLGLYADETAALCDWHIPGAHYLEAWGDLVGTDGSLVVQQPLIAPLYGGLSAIQVLALIHGGMEGDGFPNGRALVQETLGASGFQWQKAVHDGVVRNLPIAQRVSQAVSAESLNWDALPSLLGAADAPTKPTAAALELNFVLDSSVCDGRFANNGWLQESPDPLSKLTWDNAALLSPKTAEALSVSDGDMVSVTSGGQNLNIPTMVVPGTADFVLILPMGYGREFEGTVCSAAGFNVYPLRTLAAPYISAGATVKATGEQYELVSTQDYGSMVEPYTGIERPIVREASLEDYRAKPGFVQDKEILPVLQTGPYATTEEQLKSLWTPPNHTEGQQWAMTIDLNLCNGCNACAIACQAENNIPVVGKERVADGREMSWLRMDRYFTGTEDEPEAVVQPMACAHCEMAPCENVCPVAATTHSPDGLNDMAYNRCIGTRYCSNNCPFKVRRFNFFNYNKENEAAFPLHGMQKNPNVTVRFRGVMEKCTYCVQRIQEAKIAAKRDTVDGFIPDGTIETACSQICATKAIVFGDKNDPQSKVAQSRLNPRNYGVLAELNLHARTTYLAKIRNLNPALVDNGSTN